jgi:hypothetical protein
MIRPLALVCAGLVPALVATQFLLVGLAVFADGTAWGWHRAVGGALSFPVLGLAALTLGSPGLRAARRPALLLAGFYLMQFGWLGLGAVLSVAEIRALHAVNALAVAALGDGALRAVLRTGGPVSAAPTTRTDAA